MNECSTMRDLSICPLHASLNSFLSSHQNSISVRPFDHFIQKCIILLIGIILGPPLYETCHRRYVYVIVGSSSFSFLFLFQIWDLYENGNNCCTRRSTLSSFSVGYFFFLHSPDAASHGDGDALPSLNHSFRGR